MARVSKFTDEQKLQVALDLLGGKLIWKHQLGTAAREECLGAVTVDPAGNCYMGGSTQGKFGGDLAGQADIFISKFGGDGRLLWIRQFGTDQDDVCHGVAAEGSIIYLGGITWGRLGQDQFVRGNGDAFVAKCDDSGKVLWVRQFGTAGRDAVNGMSLCSDGSGDVLLGGCQNGAPEPGILSAIRQLWRAAVGAGVFQGRSHLRPWRGHGQGRELLPRRLDARGLVRR